MSSPVFRWTVASAIILIAAFLAAQVWSTRIGMYRYKTGDVKSASPILKVAHVLNPFTDQINDALADIYIQEGSLKKAEGLLNKTIARNPDDAKAHNLRGVVFQAQELFDEAMAEYETAVRLDPGFAVARFNRGYLLLRNGDVRKGAAEIGKAVELEPSLSVNRDEIFKRMNVAVPPEPMEITPNGENKSPTAFSK